MKSNITERDLLSLNFEKQKVDDSMSSPFYYYTFEIEDFTLISNADDQAIDEGWIIDIFDYHRMKIYDADLLKRFIEILHEINNQSI